MAFKYRDKRFCIEQGKHYVDLLSMAQKIKNPFYVYDLDALLARLEFFKKNVAPAKVYYAVKANTCAGVLKVLCEQGVGVDVVSGGEIQLARKAGFLAKDIIFSGVGKTVGEIELALREGILQFNVESVSELKRIAEVAGRLNKLARVAFRMNPDVDIPAHPYIKTGLREGKFGLDEENLPELKEVLQSRSLQLCGLTLHIGSQLFDLRPLKLAIQRVKRLYEDLLKDFDLSILDVGGGLGLDYRGDIEGDEVLIKEYGLMLKDVMKGFSGQVFVEPGRIITGRFGCLVGEVQYIKRGLCKNFIVLNTGMHHLIRPCLYQAYHRILPLEERSGDGVVYDVVGPICESSDILGRDRVFSGLREGDFLGVLDAGAYGAVMASRYNAHDLPREILVSAGSVVS